MNERIKDLLGQAYDEAVPETWTTLSSDQLGRIHEKFAELIVRECANVCDDLQKWSSTEPRHCASDIRIHFGVSE